MLKLVNVVFVLIFTGKPSKISLKDIPEHPFSIYASFEQIRSIQDQMYMQKPKSMYNWCD